MINIETIKRLSTQYQTTSFNVIREYCQHLFLSYFYQNKNSNYLLFKGGTALRFVYKSPRFSEDLDFTSLVLTKSRLEDIVQDALVEIDRLGIRVTLEEFESTSGGYIGIIEFSLLGYNVSIQLNISSRKARAIKGDVILIASEIASPSARNDKKRKVIARSVATWQSIGISPTLILLNMGQWVSF